MCELFLSVLNMSLTASYVILIVIFVRLLLKKTPKVISYALWGVVAIRLIIPFSFESIFSLLPRNANTAPIPQDIIYRQTPQISSGMEAVDSLVNQSLSEPIVRAGANPIQIYVRLGTYLWILGIMVLLIYSLISTLLLKKQLKSAHIIEKNIYEAKNLKTPFVIGLIRPKIYLPVGLNATERSYVLQHEQTHIKRTDHIIKVLSFLILSIHWFNPLVWVAFMLMSTDMELSCDERVLKEMNGEIKKSYANSLLALATEKHIINGSPLTFGEGNVKTRVRNVLDYKKPKFWILATAIIAVIAVSIGLLSNPIVKSEALEVDLQAQGSYSMINPDPAFSVTGEAIPNVRKENEYHNTEDKYVDNSFDVEKTLEIIMSSPKTSSNPHDYINAHINEYESFFKYGGEDALQYMLTQFETGNAEGLRGQIMMLLCKELLGARNNITDDSLSPQEWYNALRIRQVVVLPNYEYDGQDAIEKLVYDTEIEIETASNQRGGFIIVAPSIFGSYEEEGWLKVFATIYSARYKLFGNTLSEEGGSIIPVAMTYRKNDNDEYILEKYEQAQDGMEFGRSIREYSTLPVSGKEIIGLADKILKHYSNYDDLHTLLYSNLYHHLKKNGITDATLTNSYGEIIFSMSDLKYKP
jgi:beta-lactamase regulating signal transducer with metallopeptidase domain